MKVTVEQTATDVDQMKRLSSNLVNVGHRASPSPQVTNCETAFINGSPHRIHQQTITSPVVHITRRWHLGSSKAASSKNGSQPVHYSGSTENVRSILIPTLSPADTVLYYSWFWQKCPLVCRFLIVPLRDTDVFFQFHGYPRH